MKKLPVVVRASRIEDRVRGVGHDLRLAHPVDLLARARESSRCAAVAITVRGHSALTAMPSARNSSAMPSTHMLMPNFAIV